MTASLFVSGASVAQYCPEDVDGNGVVNAGDLAAVIAAWGNTCAAVIDSIEPSSGTPKGGTTVVITGQHLAATSSVTFGGAEAAEIVSRTASELTVVTPPGSIGAVDVVVATPAGSATIQAAFAYTSPLPWATVLEGSPDPAVVTDESLRAAIIATGLPWRVRDNISGIEMLLVPPGEFMMGCSPSLLYACGSAEGTPWPTPIAAPFYLGRYEVTQSEWYAAMGGNPSFYSGFPDSPNRPVEQVSWTTCQTFAGATGLRLPTSAEWEYACRAGTATAFNNGSDDDATLPSIAWCATNATNTRPVGLKPANQLGFHDMHGNVEEWIDGWFSQSPPPGQRELRGGGYAADSGSCRSSFRGGAYGYSSYRDLGVRMARDP